MPQCTDSEIIRLVGHAKNHEVWLSIMEFGLEELKRRPRLLVKLIVLEALKKAVRGQENPQLTFDIGETAHLLADAISEIAFDELQIGQSVIAGFQP